MLSGESLDKFREVTAAQKAALEAADALWVRPPQLFIDLWNTVCKLNTFLTIGKYNETTGFFELHHLKDITYEQALYSFIYTYGINGTPRFNTEGCRARVILPTKPFYGTMPMSIERYGNSSTVEVISAWQCSSLAANKIESMFEGMTSLTHIYGFMYIGVYANTKNTFRNCKNLEYVNFGYMRANIDFSDCPNINADTIKSLTVKNNGIPETGIVITVHPDVYAKLTDETNTEWHQFLLVGADKNIQFATS